MEAEADARRDPLTGVLRYEAFAETFARWAAEADERQGSVSLAMVDLDWFDRVNKSHGRTVGDEVLRRMARHLADAIADQGTLFRYGGDEFLVLLPRVEKEQAFLLLEEARRSFDAEHRFPSGDVVVSMRLTLSVGVAAYPDDGGRAQDLLRKVSDALHRAKARSGNAVCLAREERMVTKTSHYTHGQLERLSELAQREGVGEAVLLREALDDLLRKYSL